MFFLVFAIAVLPAAQCEPDITIQPVIEQYRVGETDPWQEFLNLRNLCRERLCGGYNPACPGTVDQFVVRPVEGTMNRDRFMFFEQTPDYEDCTTVPFFDPSKEYRSAGRYSHWEGVGESPKTYPLGRNAAVGHVRRYERGVCSAAETIVPLKDQVSGEFKSTIEDHWAINKVEITRDELNIFLGSDDCNDVLADNRDFVHMRYDFRVKPHSAGYWYFRPDLWWRLVIRDRSRYLDCGEGGACREYIQCINDDECKAVVPGSRCKQGICHKRHSLDVADYGSRFRYESGCSKIDLICKKYYNVFKAKMADLQANLYRDFFVPLLAGIYDRTWDGYENMLCDSWDCKDFGSNFNLDGRCSVGSTSAPYCEFRPYYIYDVNLYPNEMELVLSPSDDRREYPQYVILDLLPGGLCEEVTPGWSPTSTYWMSVLNP